MRRVQREALDAEMQDYLNRRQADVAVKLQSDLLQLDNHWRSSRQSGAMKEVLVLLQRMMGQQQRCMYCVDSHGCDIEHFWPKSGFPQRMYLWSNLLLCCTECGRFKGNQFPLQNGMPLLLNPTIDEPWHYLDFDPDTGNISARYDIVTNAFKLRGETTVNVLQLDQREALAAGYQKTWRRLSARMAGFLEAPTEAHVLIADLIEHDDHGLLGWFFKGSGQSSAPMMQLRTQHTSVWEACCKAFQFR